MINVGNYNIFDKTAEYSYIPECDGVNLIELSNGFKIVGNVTSRKVYQAPYPDFYVVGDGVRYRVEFDYKVVGTVSGRVYGMWFNNSWYPTSNSSGHFSGGYTITIKDKNRLFLELNNSPTAASTALNLDGYIEITNFTIKRITPTEIQNVYFNGTKLDHIYYNGTLVYGESPTPSTLLSYPHSLGTLSRMTKTGDMTFDTYNISASPVRFTQNDEDDRAGSVIVNFQPVTASGTLTSAKLYLYGKGSGSGFLEVDVGNTYVGDFRLDTTSQERIITLPTGINPNDPIKLTLDEESGYYVDINAMKLELNYDGGRMLMGVKKSTRVQEPSYHRYEKLESEVE